MICYFSCTGNTRWAAEELGKALDEELVDMSTTEPSSLFSSTEVGSLGICIPVHGWRPPVFVREWLLRADFSKCRIDYCWALLTAGDTLGESAFILEHQLSAMGLRLDSMFSLLMPESYVGLPFMDVDTAANELRKVTKAREALQGYKSAIESRDRGIRELHIGRWPRINSRILGGAFERWLLTDKPFHVKGDKCTGCGTCVRHCPMGNMTMGTDRMPQWTHSGRCLSCFACYHHCPTHAIEYGSRTSGKGQYYFGKKQNL